jgi:hypothetical protein
MPSAVQRRAGKTEPVSIIIITSRLKYKGIILLGVVYKYGV